MTLIFDLHFWPWKPKLIAERIIFCCIIIGATEVMCYSAFVCLQLVCLLANLTSKKLFHENFARDLTVDNEGWLNVGSHLRLDRGSFEEMFNTARCGIFPQFGSYMYLWKNWSDLNENSKLYQTWILGQEVPVTGCKSPGSGVLVRIKTTDSDWILLVLLLTDEINCVITEWNCAWTRTTACHQWASVNIHQGAAAVAVSFRSTLISRC